FVLRVFAIPRCWSNPCWSPPWSANTFLTPSSSTPRTRDNLPSSGNRLAPSRIPYGCGAKHERRRCEGIDRAERAEHDPAEATHRGLLRFSGTCTARGKESRLHFCSG